MGDYGQYIVPSADVMINFKVGQPAQSLLPLDYIRQAAMDKFSQTDQMFLQYGHIQGYPKFRKSLSGFLTNGYKAEVDPERLFITNGVTGGLALICSLFCQTGNLVFMEEPSYFLALSIMKDFKYNIKQIPMDQDGLNVDKVEDLLKQGVRPKMLYCIPTCHNPTGRTMSIEKRKHLVRLSIEYDFIIVADEVYQLLSFPHITPPPPMFTFDTEGTVLALGSFSKILAPALRLGWIQGHPKLLNVITNCGQLDSSGGISPVISGIVHSAIDMGLQQKYLDATKDILWNRADRLMKQLTKSLPKGTTFEVPDGGYFVLVKLPEPMLAAELLPIAMEHKVQFLPGASFGKSMQNFLRLSFSWYDLDDLALGADRLSAAITAYAKQIESRPKTEKLENNQNTKVMRVAIHGSTGRLGKLIAEQLEANDQFVYNGPVGRKSASSPATIPKDTDVVIDVSLPQGTKDLVAALTQNPLPLVVGTTGTGLPMKELKDYASLAPVVLKSNFSVGVPLLSELVKKTALAIPSDWNCSINEIHHTKKMDAPSGTANTLLKSVESTGAFNSNVECTSQRLGDEIGQHTVFFAGQGERIELKHQATRREVFAIGALRSAEWIKSQSNGFYMK